MTADRPSPDRVPRSRRGVATVELAVCLPILVVIVLGSIEANSAIFLKQRLTWAAYEAARLVITPGNASSNAITAGTAVLTEFSVSGGTITVTPTVTGTTAAEMLGGR